MSDHVMDRVGDYLANRLDGAARESFEVHMRRCSDCATQVAWCRDLKEAALREGLGHVAPPRILDLARDRALATPAESAHVETCSDCGREIAWAAHLPEENTVVEDEGPAPGDPETAAGFSAPRTVGARPRQPRRVRLGWAGGGLAAAAAILALMLLPGGPVPDTAGLADIQPLPVRITRDVPEAGSFEENRILGLEAYAAGDYGTALGRLAEASRMQPGDQEVRLYMASAVLLQGGMVEAKRLLEPIAAAGGEPPLRNEAAWLLAQIALLEDRPAEARPLLQGVAGSGGRHDDEARRILDALDGAD